MAKVASKSTAGAGIPSSLPCVEGVRVRGDAASTSLGCRGGVSACPGLLAAAWRATAEDEGPGTRTGEFVDTSNMARVER